MSARISRLRCSRASLRHRPTRPGGVDGSTCHTLSERAALCVGAAEEDSAATEVGEGAARRYWVRSHQLGDRVTKRQPLRRSRP